MTQEIYRRVIEKLPMPGCSYFLPVGLPNKLALSGDHKILNFNQLRDFLASLGVDETDIEIVYGVRPKNAPANRYVVLLPLPRD